MATRPHVSSTTSSSSSSGSLKSTTDGTGNGMFGINFRSYRAVLGLLIVLGIQLHAARLWVGVRSQSSVTTTTKDCQIGRHNQLNHSSVATEAAGESKETPVAEAVELAAQAAKAAAKAAREAADAAKEAATAARKATTGKDAIVAAEAAKDAAETALKAAEEAGKAATEAAEAAAASTTTTTAKTTSTTTTKNQVPDITPSTTLARAAAAFVAERENAYDLAGEHKHWKLRGHGHLCTYHNLILAAEVIPGNIQDEPSEIINNRDHMVMGRNSVVIWNVHPKTQTTFDECHKLSLWVRVNGPEIFAGKAQAVPVTASSLSSSSSLSKCFWKFDFDIALAGQYAVDAKMVMWNGLAPLDFSSGTACPETYRTSNNVSLEAYQEAPHNTSLMGFKLYSPEQGCCEECRRLPGCKYWATPPKLLPHPSNPSNGCEFYFDKDTPLDDVPTTRIMPDVIREQIAGALAAERLAARKAALAQAAQEAQAPQGTARRLREVQRNNVTTAQRMRHHSLVRRRLAGAVPEAWGSSKSNITEVSNFVGCGWSYQFTLEFPCLSGDLDDLIFMSQTEFQVSSDESAVSPRADDNNARLPLPLCQARDESMSYLLDTTENRKPSVGRWVREPWPTASLCPDPLANDANFSSAFPIPAHNGNYPHCWNREDLAPLNKKCVEMNCRLIKQHGHWLTSAIQKETQWNGVWRNYKCDYLEFTNDQLSECFVKGKYSKIEVQGASIGGMMTQYLLVRLKNVTLYDAAQPDARTAILSSLTWPHLLWRNTQEQWIAKFNDMPSLLPPTDSSAAAPTTDFYWASPMFATSEREPYVHLDRAIQLAHVTEKTLVPKGYKIINAFDPSAAFTYDTAAQRDGLHIIGPPLKAVITKLFHHMCSDLVEGTRL